MIEVLPVNNHCRQNILTIVSGGNAIIAEILRLKDYIPDVFHLETKADRMKWGEILMDFKYFKIAEAHEKKIESNAELQDLDEQFRDNYIEILTRFYLAFDSTYQYAISLKNFVQELNEGRFIQQTLESVLQDEEGKQLLCEALYLFGVMLLVLDLYIPGTIRERLIICYYRYSADKSHGESHIDDVCMLLRSTGYLNVSNSKKVAGYPENLFSRVTFDQHFVKKIIGCLRSDDIYNQISVYPNPGHRSTALSNQAAMLFVCLYFSSDILKNEASHMREIVDKFFPDNWVVSVYMGITINLLDAWEHYKAAKFSLSNVVGNTALKLLCTAYKEKCTNLLAKTDEILKTGFLNESFLLQNVSKIINLITECNVTIRWYFLHTSSSVMEISGSKKTKQIIDQIIFETCFKTESIFLLLLNASQLELKVKASLRKLIEEKTIRFENYKKETVERINELSVAFSGTRPLWKIEKNENLTLWFNEISQEVQNLCHNNSEISGRKIIQLIQALKEVQEFHNLESNLQIKQYMSDTNNFLCSMIQIIKINENVLINIQLISDLSYAWISIDTNYTKLMQESIKQQPSLVIKLRATFLKLASALEIPLLRINQSHSEDLISVSQYYSNELANYVRKVVQIIPETMFIILAQIIKLQTEIIKEVPIRLDKDKLKEHAQLTGRYTVAKLTYSISVFTEGILMMKKTLVGVFELDPKKLLEDGIRKELVNNLSKALHEGLIFSSKGKQNELESRLHALGRTIDGYKRSFEYIQDYLNVHGLKILQEELSRIINYNVEQECNTYVRNKIQDWQSLYQSSTISIPTFPSTSTHSTSHNFIGRLATEILIKTDYKTSTYLELKGAWYEKRTHKEILNFRIFTNIRDAIGPAVLVGLDKLFTYMLIKDLRKNIKKLQKNVTTNKMWQEILITLTNKLKEKGIIDNPNKFYLSYTTQWIKVWPKFFEWILETGQKQILRRQIQYELNSSSKLKSKGLESSLCTLNRALFNEFKASQTKSVTSTLRNSTLFHLNDYFQFTGLYSPLQQKVIITRDLHYVPLFMLLFTISHIHRLQFLRNVNCLLTKKFNDHIDGIAMIFGIFTVLKQFNNQYIILYLEYMAQYINSWVQHNKSNKEEFGEDIITSIHYIQTFAEIANISISDLKNKIPEVILHQYEFKFINLLS